MPYQKPPIGAKLNFGHPLAKGLVGCWLFNEGSGDKVFDYSGQGNNGTVMNVAAQTIASGWNSGVQGNALRFDGSNDYVRVANNKHFDFGAKDFTIYCRIYFYSMPTGNRYPNEVAPFCQGPAGSVDENAFYIGSTTIRFCSSDNSIVLEPNHGMTVNRWYGAFCTRIGNNWSIYVDAILIGTATDTRTLASYTDPIDIMGDDAGAKNVFNGLMSEQYVYNRGLTATEIAYLNASPHCMFEPAYPPFWWGVEAPEPPEPSTFTPRITMIM